MPNSKRSVPLGPAALAVALHAQAERLARELVAALHEADERRRGRLLGGVGETELRDAVLTLVMRAAVTAFAQARDLTPRGGRLFRDPARGLLARLSASGSRPLLGRVKRRTDEAFAAAACAELGVEEVGNLYEHLLDVDLASGDGRARGRRTSTRTRKRSGSFFTPPELVRLIVRSALAQPLQQAAAAGPEQLRTRLLALRVCDPAMGAGAFLIGVCQKLSADLDRQQQRTGHRANPVASRRRVARECLYGVDTSALAVAVAEASLWLLVGDRRLSLDRVCPHLFEADSLAGFDWHAELAEVFETARGFDLVIGNPPWVAFAGRATQPLSPARRAFFKRTFRAWRGYPTLHGLFVQRAAELAPTGTVALLLPSPVADLDGYRAVRRELTTRHVVREPLLEFGQDAFCAVTQPCFALIADPADAAGASDARWALVERQRASGAAEPVRVPEVLQLLAQAAPLPAELFGEMGFQSNRVVTRSLFLRADRPDAKHRYPLLEGRNVTEFAEGAARLFLNSDPELLRRAKVRLRPEREYRRVSFVVRQTAAMPIAALHGGLPFRNSLLAGFAHPDLSAELMVGLLNSALYRALHLAGQRDARQAAFPQVKIRALRTLPCPPVVARLRRRITELARRATAAGIDATRRAHLDAAVFELFAVPEAHRACVLDFLARRAPKLGYAPTGAADSKPAVSLDAVRARVGEQLRG